MGKIKKHKLCLKITGKPGVCVCVSVCGKLREDLCMMRNKSAVKRDQI